MKRSGLKLRLHDLRHTHAALILKSGVHPKIVSERLGHASVAFTLDTYSHVQFPDCRKLRPRFLMIISKYLIPLNFGILFATPPHSVSQIPKKQKTSAFGEL